MEVKQDFKKTDIGIIPKDWEVIPIMVIANVRTGPFGSSLHEKDYVQDGTPIITVEHLSEHGVVHSNLPMVSDFDRRRLNTFALQKDDIVFSRVGSVDRNSLISEKENGWLFSGRLLRIRVQNKNVHALFLSYYFHSEPFKQRVRNVAVGQTMASLNTQIINNMEVVLPGNPEQHAIAAALSDVDSLLTALAALIAKKRLVKQGAMQELLSGKQRLPGFSKKWERLNITEHSTLKARIGWQGLTTAEYLTSGNYRLITGTDFVDGKVDWENCSFVEKARYDQDKNIQLRIGDVLITKDGTIGKVAYVDHLPSKATLNSGIFVVRPKNNKYFPLYFSYVLSSKIFDDFLQQLQAGSTINHLYQKDFMNFKFSTPEYKEQQAIAEILSDMDAEITALEQRREKTRLLKQGMMQELLTGRIRLV